MRLCSADGCDRKHYGHGLCRTHHAFWKRNGTLDRRPLRYCEVESCEDRVYGHGYCRLHWERWTKHGDPLLGAAPKRTLRRCAACGVDFWPRVAPGGKNARRVCYSCAPAPGNQAACLACGERFTRQRGSHYACSRPCKKRVMALHKVGYFDCSECAQLFTAHGNALGRLTEGKPGYCSTECRSAARRTRSRESQRRDYEKNGKRLARKNAALRRARKRGLETESFTHEQVFERDGWRCHICRKPIDKRLTWPDPMAPQVDHLIPVSLGGAHTLANVAASHARCNGSKGARAVGEQLRLVG